MTPETKAFFDTIIACTDPGYLDLATGIADAFGRFGTLTEKQFKALATNATRNHLNLPPELIEARSAPTAVSSTTTSSTGNHNWGDLGGGTITDIQADLFDDMARAFSKAAQRLRAINETVPF
jgi:hypothetical protein